MTTIDYAYNRFCIEHFPLPRESNIAHLEARIGVLLPEDFRRYVLEFNGGYFDDPDIVPPSVECPVEALTFISGIGASHIEAELGRPSDLSLFDNNNPPEILPVGTTPLGGLIILSLKPESCGEIWYKQAYGDFYYLADGIENFFDLLHTPPATADTDS